MFLTRYKKECNFFLWIDQPISHGMKERLSYSPQPRVTRFHPYGEIKEMFEKHRQEAKKKAFIQHQRLTRKYDEGALMCDNGFSSLGTPITSFLDLDTENGCTKYGNRRSFKSKKRKKTLEMTQMLQFVQKKRCAASGILQVREC